MHFEEDTRNVIPIDNFILNRIDINTSCVRYIVYDRYILNDARALHTYYFHPPYDIFFTTMGKEVFNYLYNLFGIKYIHIKKWSNCNESIEITYNKKIIPPFLLKKCIGDVLNYDFDSLIDIVSTYKSLIVAQYHNNIYYRNCYKINNLYFYTSFNFNEQILKGNRDYQIPSLTSFRNNYPFVLKDMTRKGRRIYTSLYSIINSDFSFFQSNLIGVYLDRYSIYLKFKTNLDEDEYMRKIHSYDMQLSNAINKRCIVVDE